MKITLKSQLKKLAKDFDLKYNSEWFGVMWVSKEDNKYMEYVEMCPDPIYTRFGNTPEKRIANIEKFARSSELRKIRNRYGGQAISEKGVAFGLEYCRTIKNFKLRKRLLGLYRKIKSKLHKGNLAILTKTRDKKEKENLVHNILLHEWIHNLLKNNKLFFKSVSSKHWKYDEGLVTFLENYISKRLSYLELGKNQTKYPNARVYYIYAIKFRELLKDKTTPKERKSAIIKLMNKLKR